MYYYKVLFVIFCRVSLYMSSIICDKVLFVIRIVLRVSFYMQSIVHHKVPFYSCPYMGMRPLQNNKLKPLLDNPGCQAVGIAKSRPII